MIGKIKVYSTDPLNKKPVTIAMDYPTENITYDEAGKLIEELEKIRAKIRQAKKDADDSREFDLIDCPKCKCQPKWQYGLESDCLNEYWKCWYVYCPKCKDGEWSTKFQDKSKAALDWNTNAGKPYGMRKWIS